MSECNCNKPDPSTAVIQFILENEFELDEPMTFLRLWNEGEFDKLREEWGDDIDLPDEIFIGADTQFVPKNTVECEAVDEEYRGG